MIADVVSPPPAARCSAARSTGSGGARLRAAVRPPAAARRLQRCQIDGLGRDQAQAGDPHRCRALPIERGGVVQLHRRQIPAAARHHLDRQHHGGQPAPGKRFAAHVQHVAFHRQGRVVETARVVGGGGPAGARAHGHRHLGQRSAGGVGHRSAERRVAGPGGARERGIGGGRRFVPAPAVGGVGGPQQGAKHETDAGRGDRASVRRAPAAKYAVKYSVKGGGSPTERVVGHGSVVAATMPSVSCCCT